MALNRADVTIDGRTLALEASVAAADVYADEFFKRLRKPYKGILEDDLLTVYGRAQAEVEVRAKMDGDGNPVTNDDGSYVTDRRARLRTLPNPEYRGVDTVALLRIAWAMSVAAGSYDDQWKAFEQWATHDTCMSVSEQAQLYAVIIYELGARHIFRNPDGHGDADEPDAGLEGEGVDG